MMVSTGYVVKIILNIRFLPVDTQFFGDGYKPLACIGQYFVNPEHDPIPLDACRLPKGAAPVGDSAVRPHGPTAA